MFYANIDDETLEGLTSYYFYNIGTESSEDFWTIYLLGAYQYTEDDDGDPSFFTVYGIVDGEKLGDGKGATLFMEVNRATEYNNIGMLFGIPPWYERPVTPKHVVALRWSNGNGHKTLLK